jgi:signal transduction histidine kinase
MSNEETRDSHSQTAANANDVTTRAWRLSYHELVAALRQLLTAQERERGEIATELRHVGQSLCAVKYALEASEEMVRKSVDCALQQRLQRAILDLRDVIDDVRAIGARSRPAVLDDFGAVAAIRQFCREFAQAHPSIQVRTDISLAERTVPDRLRTVLLRSIQRLLDCIVTGTEVHRVTLSLSRAADQLVLEVLDTQIGGSATAGSIVRSARGEMLEVRARVAMAEGEFDLLPGETGTLARIQWKLSASEMARGGDA